MLKHIIYFHNLMFPRFSAGTLAPSCAICGTVWMCTSQRQAFCIYAAYLWIGEYIHIYTHIHTQIYMHASVCSFNTAYDSSLEIVITVALQWLPFCRYYAIVKPLKYPISMTKRVVGIMLLNTWISPALLSFLPIFIGWYTTEEHKIFVKENPEQCSFVVNKFYAIISSSISFWIPCTIMIFTYLAIFREANRQEKQLMMRHGNAMLMHRPSMQPSGRSNRQSLNYHSARQTVTARHPEPEADANPRPFIMFFCQARR